MNYNQITTACLDNKSQEGKPLTQYSTVLRSRCVELTCFSDYVAITSYS
jgi:hypothetical protein